jgi:2-dehydropantoate 2-reductase
MRIGVIGAGGIGGYFGARLAAAGSDVVFLARGAHLAALRADGLRLTSPRGDLHLPVNATDDPAEAAKCDAVLFCVKGYATDGALPAIEPMLGPDGFVVCLQNGVGGIDRVSAAAGPERTLGGAAYISCHLRGPGVLEHVPGPAGFVIGEAVGGPSPRGEALAALAREAGVDAEVSPDIRTVLWAKLGLICGLAGATAATRLPIGEVRTTPGSRAVLRGLIEETAAVGRAEGAVLAPDFVDRTLAMLDGVGPGMVSSLYEDLVHGRPMELAELHGEVLRRAEAAGLDVPVTRTVHGVLEPWAVRAGRR